MDATCTIDDQTFPTVRPGSAAELCDLVRRATAEDQALYPVGGGTRLGFGLPPARPGLAVDLRGLSAVIDYPARDMTITVQAGITLGALQKVLAAENQRLPIDVPQPGVATLGGSIASNTAGPRRLGAGTLRDYVIGISVVTDEGQETKSGGRVVKNVAGYDLAKLHTGAFGTLGVISQVTLKVRPLPEESALVTFGCTADDLPGLLDRLNDSRTRPICLELLNARGAAEVGRRAGRGLPDRPWVVLVGFEDNEHAVRWQLQQLIRELTAAGVPGVEAVAGSAAAPLWDALTEGTAPSAAVLSMQAGVLPGAVAAFCRAADAWPPGSARVHAHAGSGVVHVHHLDLTAADARGMLEVAAREADSSGGHVVLPRCPTGWKASLPVWGAPRGDAWLMREVKRRLDPAGRFNPGRFLPGL